MVKENLERVRRRIAAAAERAGRDPRAVRLICVTKGVAPASIKEALAGGAADVGENKVQEAEQKKPLLGPGPRWHLIGHLQRNKVRSALETFDLIHSVDRLELGDAIQRVAAEMERTVEVLVQVNAARIETRSGVSPEEAAPLVEKLRKLSALKVTGLMTMAPVAPPEQVRSVFRQVRELAAQLGLKELSMGMSQDFETAVEEGATMVRVGTAIFGERA